MVFNSPEEENAPCLAFGPAIGPPGSLLGCFVLFFVSWQGIAHLSIVTLHSLVKCQPLLHLLHIPKGIGSLLGLIWFSLVSFEMTLHTTIKTFELLDCLKASSGGFY